VQKLLKVHGSGKSRIFHVFVRFLSSRNPQKKLPGQMGIPGTEEFYEGCAYEIDDAARGQHRMMHAFQQKLPSLSTEFRRWCWGASSSLQIINSRR
jgi:hypothetical protein